MTSSNPSDAKRLPLEALVPMWDAINEFADAPKLSVRRQEAVVKVERIVRSLCSGFVAPSASQGELDAIRGRDAQWAESIGQAFTAQAERDRRTLLATVAQLQQQNAVYCTHIADLRTERDAAIRARDEAREALRQFFSDVINVAAGLARNDGMDRLFPDSHPRPAQRGYWLALLEHAGDLAKDRAVQLRNIANKASAALASQDDRAGDVMSAARNPS